MREALPVLVGSGGVGGPLPLVILVSPDAYQAADWLKTNNKETEDPGQDELLLLAVWRLL